MNLTGKQCKTARLLLKWNLRELAYRSKLKPNQIDSFERGNKQLFQGDKDIIGKVFKKEGIQFLDFGEVRLDEEQKEQAAIQPSGSLTQTTYYAEMEQFERLYENKADFYRPGQEDYSPTAD